jgi:hypothetical protein
METALRSRVWRWDWRLAGYGVILLSYFLRVYQLDQGAVTRDQAMTIEWFVRPGLSVLLTQNKDLNNHPLVSLLAHAFSSAHDSIFAMRWPLALIGVFTVAVFIRLAHRFFGPREGVLAGWLVGISAYHVLISQSLRGYVVMVGFTALGFYLAHQGVKTGRMRYWIGFGVVSALNCYAHLYGVVAIVVTGLPALAMQAMHHARGPVEPARLPRLAAPVLSVILAGLIALALYAPMSSQLLPMLLQGNAFSGSSGEALERPTDTLAEAVDHILDVIAPFSLVEDSMRLRLEVPTLHYSPFDGIARLAQSNAALYLSVLSVGLGLVFSWRRYPRQTLLCGAWLVTPLLLQAIIQVVLPGAYARGRFLAFVYPAYLLLMLRGWLGLKDWLADRGRHRRGLGWLGVTVGGLGLGTLTALNVAWLGAYYWSAINEHWPDMARHISQNAAVQDVILCGQNPDTACKSDLLARTDRAVEKYQDVTDQATLRTHLARLSQPGRVWVAMPHLTAGQVDEIKQSLDATSYWLAGNPHFDMAGVIRHGSHPSLRRNLQAALETGTQLCIDVNECYRYHIALTHLHLVTGDAAAAKASFARAEGLFTALSDGDTASESHADLREQVKIAGLDATVTHTLPAPAIRTNRNFAGIVRLVGYEMPTASLSPGNELNLVLYWQALTASDRDYVAEVRLSDVTLTPMNETNARPIRVAAAAPAWQPGRVYTDARRLALAGTLDAPLVARVELRLLDFETHHSIPAFGEDGRPADSALTLVKVIPAIWPSSPPSMVLDRGFAGLIVLAGYDLVEEPAGVALYWRPLKRIQEDYTVFVHLLDADGNLVAQMDGPPRQNRYPTSWWAPGEMIIDRRPAPLVPLGSYRVLVGLYRLADGCRLPLADGSGEAVSLGEIHLP